MKHTFSRAMTMMMALSLGASSCADPATQPQVSINVRGLTAVTTGRGSGIGDVTIEVLFAPAGDGGANRPHRRVAPWHNADVEALVAQVPAGRYQVSASVFTVVDCNRVATNITLGTAANTVMIEVPATNATAVDLTLSRAAGTCM